MGSLATAICCDSRTKVYAEPRFLFQSPFVDLFKHLPADGTPTTFYDTVCGLPLFTAPMNRTLQEFQDDTNEHGWPSFRPAELIKENVRTDEDGDRWCLDTACLAGNPKKE